MTEFRSSSTKHWLDFAPLQSADKVRVCQNIFFSFSIIEEQYQKSCNHDESLMINIVALVRDYGKVSPGKWAVRTRYFIKNIWYVWRNYFSLLKNIHIRFFKALGTLLSFGRSITVRQIIFFCLLNNCTWSRIRETHKMSLTKQENLSSPIFLQILFGPFASMSPYLFVSWWELTIPSKRNCQQRRIIFIKH